MRIAVWPVALLGALVLSGCARHKTGPAPTPALSGPNVSSAATGAAGSSPKFIVSAESGLAGKVVRVNENLRFVVLNFPIGRLPAVEQRLSVYRGGIKVGELKISGPHQDDNIVADIVAGEALAGDEARDR